MNVIYCKKCFDRIASSCNETATLWIALCDFFIKLRGTFQLREIRVPNYSTNFKLLERNGYIITTDSSSILNSFSISDRYYRLCKVSGFLKNHTGKDTVRVSVKGYQHSNNCESFCINRLAHGMVAS